MATVRVEEDLGAELARWVEAAVRIQRGGVAQTWDELTVRELPSLPSMSPTLSARRHRFDLRFSAGPFSNEAPTTWAHELMAELPRRLDPSSAVDGRSSGVETAR
ncbi:hypothetical protein [Gaiella occulta]|uniref:hypothetical protein n=1 Tax=Gaiella occulta TaxID=1002870 RepID=UPI000E0C501E|nr:hypothetical protein [Gaiella occulta]